MIFFFFFAEGQIAAMGKAVFKGQIDDLYGVMMQDATPKSNATAEKLWITRRNESWYLYEYNDMQDFIAKKSPRAIKLPYPFQVRIKKFTFSRYFFFLFLFLLLNGCNRAD